VILLAGCTGGGGDPSESGGDPGAGKPGSDPAHTNAPPAPHGTDADPVLALVGTTSDGVVVYTREKSTTTSLEWLDPSTKATGVIAAQWTNDDKVVIAGRVVAAWSGGSLFVSSNGASKNLSTSSAPGVFAASDDGSRIAYVSNGSLIASDVTVAPISVDACAPKLSFVGSRFLAASCDAASGDATVRTVDDAGRVVTIASSAKNDFATDDAADLVFVISSSGVASVHSLPDGVSTHIDDDVAWGRLSADGRAVVYRTNANVLKRAGTVSPIDPSTLDENVRGVVDVAPGFDQALTFSNPPDTANPSVVRFDLQLTPIPQGKPLIPTPTKPTVLLRTSTGELVGFPEVGDRALYVVDLPATGLAIGTLKSQTFPGSFAAGVETELAKGVFSPVLVKGTSNVVFADHLVMDGARVATVDVEMVDAEKGTTVSIVKGVDARFEVTSNALVTTSGARDIRVTPLP
jgi:hypothetical protein